MMGAEGGAPTWEQILVVARSLERLAREDGVAPADGSRFVRMVLDFERAVHHAKFVRPRTDPATR